MYPIRLCIQSVDRKNWSICVTPKLSDRQSHFAYTCELNIEAMRSMRTVSSRRARRNLLIRATLYSPGNMNGQSPSPIRHDACERVSRAGEFADTLCCKATMEPSPFESGVRGCATAKKKKRKEKEKRKNRLHETSVVVAIPTLQFLR